MHGHGDTGGLPSSPLGPATGQFPRVQGSGEAMKLRRKPYTWLRNSGSGGFLSSTNSVGASERSLRSFQTVANVTFPTFSPSLSPPAVRSRLLEPFTIIRDSPLTFGELAGNITPLQCAGGHSGAVHGLPPIADNLREVDSPAPSFSLDFAAASTSSSSSFPTCGSESDTFPVSSPAPSDAVSSPPASSDRLERFSISALRRSATSPPWSICSGGVFFFF